MTLLWIFLACILAGLAAFAKLLWVAVRWGREMIELQEHGVDTQGLVLAKVERRSTRSGAGRQIKYEYSDQFGRTHRRKVLVTPDAWEAHQERGPIAVVYSERRPNVSAPKYLMELSRENAQAKLRTPSSSLSKD